MENLKYFCLLLLFCCNVFLLQGQTEEEKSRLLGLDTQRSDLDEIEVEVQITATQFGYYLSKKPQAGEFIYFLNTSTNEEGQGAGTILSFRFPIGERWKTGVLLSLNTSIKRSCEDYNDFWDVRHVVNLEASNSDYFFREDIVCENDVNNLANESNSYTIGGFGFSLARVIGNNEKLYFEPSVNLGITWLTATEPYLFLKEKNSNNTRVINYIPRRNSFAMPNIGFEGKLKWRISRLFGFSASLQYNYMRGAFDYEVEETELLGITTLDSVNFAQSFENFAFGLGVYLPF